MVRFEDETKETKHTKNPATEESNKSGTKQNRNKPIDAEYEPIEYCWFDSPVVKCIVEFLFFTGIEYVVFYWLQTGQMEISAAMPSMVTCALLAGISVGKNWKRRK